MKAKPLPPIDKNKIMHLVLAEMIKMVKNGGKVGDSDMFIDPNTGNCVVSLEHNLGKGYLEREVPYFLHDHQNTTFVSAAYHEGHYEWDADTYFRPATSIVFKVHH